MTKLVIPVLERIFSLEVLWRHVGVDFFFFFGLVYVNCGLLSYFLLKYFFKSSVAKPTHTGMILLCYC